MATSALFQKIARKLNRLAFSPSEHNFEPYGRIQLALKWLQKYGPEASVLDVGGASGNNFLRRFGHKNVKTLDLASTADIQASVENIPMADGRFDVVTSIDTFEHLPVGIRLRALDEILRVSRKAVIIIAPIKSAENEQAEAYVLKYRHEPFLQEHQSCGLVDFSALRLHLDQNKIQYQYEEIDNLLTWTCLMLQNYVDLSQVYLEFHQTLENRFCPRRGALLIEK